MPGTDASTRAAPFRKFEDYVLTQVIDSSTGLTSYKDSDLVALTGPVDYTNLTIGQGLCDDGFSNQYPIGFDFEMDGVVYQQFIVNTNGWMALCDPGTQPFGVTNVLVGAASYQNTKIRTTFLSADVLLCPWFDDLRNIANVGQTTQSPVFWSSTKRDRILAGLEPSPAQVYSSHGSGVRYRNDVTPQGKRLIVRWNSFSDWTAATTVLRFEVVVYENGTIEFRYAPREDVILKRLTTQYEGATMGVFLCNLANRWRDFSIGVGYKDDVRSAYKYGGYVYDPSFSDSVPVGNEDYPGTATYTVNLTPFYNWPGLNDRGAIYRFSPPKARRKVLPRLTVRRADSRMTYPLVARTGDTRAGTIPVSFDDRRSPNFGSTNGSIMVNYPTTLTRFFGGSAQGTSERQDLYAGDFLVTGSVVKNTIEQWVIENDDSTVDPFSEVARFEQGDNNVFFVSGSNSNYVSNGFSQSLKSKTHVRMTLPVEFSITMPAGTSSIYYYNRHNRQWNVPEGTTYILANNFSTPPSPNPGGGGDWSDVEQWTYGSKTYPEDIRGFNAIGNVVSSGSNDPVYGLINSNQTDAAWGVTSFYNPQLTARHLNKEYAKSVRNNPEYSPNDDETFTVPITAPLLIEKAVFEIPFAAGPGWFADKTQCFMNLPLYNTSFDFGGPALTVALYRQVKLGSGADAPTRRDLIMTGTITHANDLTSSVMIANFPPIDSTHYQIWPVGFLSYATYPGAVVPVPDNGIFTGSVQVKSEALCAPGLTLHYMEYTPGLNTPEQSLEWIKQLLASTDLSLVTNYHPELSNLKYNLTRVFSVSPFGRGGTGFDPSGRSVLGNEFATNQNLYDPTGLRALNPLYTPFPTAQQQALLDNPPTSSFYYVANALVPLVSHFPSPYLLMPGDQLVLSISKTRPVTYADPFSGTGYTLFSGSQTQHDVSLLAGDINITLYGSQVREGTEFHDTLNQYLASNAVHEIIGAEPVVDQFEVSYRAEFSGGIADRFVMGSMTDESSPRRRLFSRIGSRTVHSLDTSQAALALSTSKAFRAQPWYERAGDARLSVHTDNTERFYDSMMPSVADVLAADESSVFIVPDNSLGINNMSTVDVGFVFMDYPISIGAGDNAAGLALLNNLNWTHAFPFEPRYSQAIRQQKLADSFIATSAATHMNSVGGNPQGSTINPRTVNGVVPILGGVSNGRASLDFMIDTTLASLGSTSGSASVDDFARTFYGFGDQNTYGSLGSLSGSALIAGTNHYAQTRDVDVFTGDQIDRFGISPVIRGWKYGVYSGLPAYNKAYFRMGRFGQFRDMLEQRAYGKFFKSVDASTTQQGVQLGVVDVKFINASTKKLTDPQNTWSNNLSFECTSSLPFFDGLSSDRQTIISTNLNLAPTVVKSDDNGNIRIV